MRRWAGLVLLALFAAGAAQAQEPAPAAGDTAALVVEVREARIPWMSPPLDTLSRPVVRGEQDYVGRQPLELNELLEGVPGAQVLELGGEEGPWQVVVRGGDPNDVAVYVDGILWNDPLGRPVNLSVIPAPLVDRVVVYRGAAPPGYPVSGSAGVIDIRLKPAVSSRVVSGRLSYDSFYNDEAAASVSGKLLTGAGLVGAGMAGGRAEYLFIDDRGAPADSGNDREDLRSHNGFGNYDLLLKWDRKAGSYRVYTAGYIGYQERQLTGPDGVSADEAESSARRGMLYAGVRRPGFLSPNVDVGVRLHYLLEDSTLKDREGEIGPARDETGRWTRAGADFFVDYYGLKSQEFSGCVSLYSDSYQPEDRLDRLVDDVIYNRSSVYFTLADRISLIEGRLTARPVVRYAYEENDYRGPTLTGLVEGERQSANTMHLSIDLAVNYLITEELALTASNSKYQRSPQFLEEFGDRRELRGNLDLRPETSSNQEIGLVYEPGRLWRFDAFRAEWRVYENEIDQRIGWEPLPDGTYAADNLGAGIVTGTELSLALNLQDEVILDLAFAYQEPRNLREDNDLPGVSRTLGHLGVSLARSYGEIFYDLYYQGERPLDEANDVMAGPRWVHNLGILYYRENYSVGFKAVNLGNDRSPEVIGYPVAGTRYMVFMELKD